MTARVGWFLCVETFTRSASFAMTCSVNTTFTLADERGLGGALNYHHRVLPIVNKFGTIQRIQQIRCCVWILQSGWFPPNLLEFANKSVKFRSKNWILPDLNFDHPPNVWILQSRWFLPNLLEFTNKSVKFGSKNWILPDPNFDRPPNASTLVQPAYTCKRSLYLDPSTGRHQSWHPKCIVGCQGQLRPSLSR
jgi:hypothetical protein